MRRLVSASLLFIAATAAGCGAPNIETAQPAANAAKPGKADQDQGAADKSAKVEADAREEAQARADFEAYQASVARKGGARADFIGYLPIDCIPVDGPGCVPLPPPISLPSGLIP